VSLANLVLVLFSVGLAAVGQLLLRHGMSTAATAAHRTGSSLVVKAATSGWVIAGLVIFGVSALTWLTTLSRVPLNVAYPFNALGFLAIIAASAVILHEHVSLWTWVGACFVVVGLIVVVVGQRTG
jgi:drug/metabolite transporter (DMT)-like permease